MVGTTIEHRRPGPASRDSQRRSGPAGRGGQRHQPTRVLRESSRHRQNGVEEANLTT
ncbi:hypothetical protein [Micromonospora antibiotica]|uniref:Uncharacterized protein n=1 Tax=Micromonospora antibiotica TaxID=2807623 RepID=A0ABS3VAN8_9ACTN|nr:hypothetical protein [Micromonospora antibiotica]MBO4162642.1 hypothetical protein [Micromonospora antibiotica]